MVSTPHASKVELINGPDILLGFVLCLHLLHGSYKALIASFL